jgi:riboflavin synthase
MFTGIIQASGRVVNTEATETGSKIEVDVSDLPLAKIALGDSIAVNGVCLTVVNINQGEVSFDVSSETLEKSLVGIWENEQRLNLELALTLQTPLGGHLVSGHVDGTGRLVQRIASDDFTAMTFEVSQDLGKFIAVKGSVAIDGISLTTNTITDLSDSDRSQFEVMLVPHTLENTTLGVLETGNQVHIEVDQLARYVDRIRQFDGH